MIILPLLKKVFNIFRIFGNIFYILIFYFNILLLYYLSICKFLKALIFKLIKLKMFMFKYFLMEILFYSVQLMVSKLFIILSYKISIFLNIVKVNKILLI